LGVFLCINTLLMF